MECEDKQWRLVAYLSKSLNKTERNYIIHNKEKKNNENQTLIKEQWIYSLAKVVIERLEVEKIKITKRKNKKVVRIVEEMKKAEIKVLKDDK